MSEHQRVTSGKVAVFNRFSGDTEAAYRCLRTRRILLYTLAPLQRTANLIDKRSQASEVVHAQPRSTSCGPTERVRLVYARPRHKQPVQMPVLVEERHSVLTPMPRARDQHEALATPWMEWVSDLELNGRTSACMACSS